MGNQEFIEKCKKLVVEYTYKHFNVLIDDSNIYVVWLAKVLQNNKALLSTTLLDGMYYELTYNGDKKELYFDAYKKLENIKCDI